MPSGIWCAPQPAQLPTLDGASPAMSAYVAYVFATVYGTVVHVPLAHTWLLSQMICISTPPFEMPHA